MDYISAFDSHGAFLIDDEVLRRIIAAECRKRHIDADALNDDDIDYLIEDIEDGHDDLIAYDTFRGYADPLEEASADEKHYHAYRCERMVCLESKRIISLFATTYGSFDELVDEHIQRLRDEFGVELEIRRDYEVRVCHVCGFTD